MCKSVFSLQIKIIQEKNSNNETTIAFIKTEAWLQEKFWINKSKSEGTGVGVDNAL